MKQVQATVVSVELQLEGDVASFSQDQRDNLRSLLRASLSCEEPACFLTLRIQPGSIDVQGILTIPHLPAGASAALTAPDATVAAVQAAATTLVSGLSLGVHVISSVSEIRTQANVVVPIVVAPPPPSPCRRRAHHRRRQPPLKHWQTQRPDLRPLRSPLPLPP